MVISSPSPPPGYRKRKEKAMEFTSVDFTTAKELIKNVPFPVCLIGKHGIGKTELVWQTAKEIFPEAYKDQNNVILARKLLENEPGMDAWDGQHIPVIARRLSQMTEGDLLGLPRVLRDQGTKFLPCHWIITACKVPVLIFLDERNRALPGVRQAVFELLEGSFHGYKLHKETKIVIAENITGNYEVATVDPAERSRTLNVILEPSVEEWLAWATQKEYATVVEYIRNYPSHLDPPNNVHGENNFPCRRSWARLGECLKGKNISELVSNQKVYVYSLVSGFVGSNIATNFVDYFHKRSKLIKFEDLLNWENKRQKYVPLTVELSNIIVEICREQLPSNFKGKTKLKHSLTRENLQSLKTLLTDLPPEARMTVWGIIQNRNELREHLDIFKEISHIIKKTMEFDK